MKKLALTAMALAGALATGCVPGEATIEVSWDLWLHGSTTTCSAEGADSVHVVARDSGGDEYVSDFACAPLPGVGDIPELYLDTYTVEVDLRDATGAVIGGPAIYPNVNVNEANTIFDVGPINFDFSVYNVQFNVDFGNVGGGNNCTATGAGGMGVAQQAIYLYRNSATQCSSYTLQSPIATDPLSDTCGGRMACLDIPDDQLILDVPPGDYEIVAEGYKSAIDANLYLCYQPTGAGTLFSIGGGPNGSQYTIWALSDAVNSPFNPAPADDTACNSTKR